MKLASLVAVVFCAFSLTAFAEIVDKSTDVSFPSEVSFDHAGKQYQLNATGVATRKKFMVKVYSVAHYLQEGAAAQGDKFARIMQDENAKQLTIRWVHNVEADKARSGYEESFKKAVTPAEYAQLKKDVDTFLAFFNNGVKKGDETIIRWIPSGYVEVISNGKPAGNITSVPFAKALWSIWFGSDSVVNRDNLVSLMK